MNGFKETTDRKNRKTKQRGNRRNGKTKGTKAYTNAVIASCPSSTRANEPLECACALSPANPHHPRPAAWRPDQLRRCRVLG